jgi:hypothetical protein
MCICSPEVLKIVPIGTKTSGDSIPGVFGIIFFRIQDSFTTRSWAGIFGAATQFD